MSCEVRPVDVDESVRPAEAAEAYVRRVAELKADTAAARWPGDVIVAADTTVVVDGLVLGKPADREDAARMLRAIAGRTHEVLTAVAIRTDQGTETFVERTTVEVAPLDDADIAWYVASGEPMDKAGAYAIQGLASRFVTRIEGSYANVVGLPVASVAQALTRLGVLPVEAEGDGCAGGGPAVS